MKYLLLLTLIIIPLVANDSLRDKALSKGLKPIPTDFETLKSQVDDSENPMTVEKILLGKKLFFQSLLP